MWLCPRRRGNDTREEKGGVVLALLTEEQEMLRDMAVQLATSSGVAVLWPSIS